MGFGRLGGSLPFSWSSRSDSRFGPLDVETARHALEMLDGLLAVSNSRQNQIAPTGTGQDDTLPQILSVEPDVRPDTLDASLLIVGVVYIARFV